MIRYLYKITICTLCWLTISPLYYYLSGKWGLKRGRLFLMLVSPLFLILYFIVLVWGYITYMNYQSKYYFTDEDRIERITGVRLPKMNIIEYHQGERSIIDYSDRLVVKFEEDISDQTYHTLDSLIATNKMNWRKKGNAYVFTAMWGNGMPAPKGEDEEEDRTFSITIEKGNNKATIYSGMW